MKIRLVRFEYSADIESLNIQAIVRPLTGMKPPVPRTTLIRPHLAHSSLSRYFVELALTANSGRFTKQARAWSYSRKQPFMFANVALAIAPERAILDYVL